MGGDHLPVPEKRVRITAVIHESPIVKIQERLAAVPTTHANVQILADLNSVARGLSGLLALDSKQAGTGSDAPHRNQAMGSIRPHHPDQLGTAAMDGPKHPWTGLSGNKRVVRFQKR